MQNVLLKASGLYTFPNNLSTVPQGALDRAINVVINRDGVIELRRGFKIYGNAMGVSLANTAHQLLTYKGRILRHYGAGPGTTLQFDSDGAGNFISFDGTYSEVSQGTRIKGLEASSNFYFTTSQGIKKIAATSAGTLAANEITNAGGIKALDLQGSLNAQTGFFTQESTVAYRVVWGIKDVNNNLILGTPSERLVLTNPLTPLLITNFNQLLQHLDTVNNPGGINDQNYLNTLKVSPTSDSNTLRSALIALASKIDNDTIITESTIDTVSASLTANTASLVFNSSVATFLEVGNTIVVTGLGGAVADLNGTHVITNVSGTTIQWAQTHGDIISTPDVNGIVQRNKYTLLTQPVVFSIPATTTELLTMQAYYDQIVTDLQIEPAGIVTTPSVFDNDNSTQSSTVDLKFTIPQGITTAYFYQIYRTALTTSTGTTVLSDLDPGDEEQLVLEDNPTAGQIAAGSVQVQDITPDSFRGANLYTNPNTGEGIAQANEVPPLALDLASFKGYTFYANTQTKQRLNLNLLSVTDLTSGVSTLTISNGITSNTYTFVDNTQEVTQVTCTVLPAVGGAGKYFRLFSGQNKTAYYVWYNVDSGNSDPAVVGKTGIEIDVLSTDTDAQIATKTYNQLNKNNDFEVDVSTNQVLITNSLAGKTTNSSDFNTGFTVSVLTAGNGEDAATKQVLISELPTPSQQVDETARSLLRVINADSAETVYGFYLSGPEDVPGEILLEERNLGGSAVFLTVNSTATGGQFSPAIPTSGRTVISDNEVSPNRIYYSKFQQPEAVPLLNYEDVGPKDKKILRILALRDNLFILKEEAIYRLSGTSTPFNVSLFDSSTLINASDSAVVLNNLIYMNSSQGVSTISDTGVSVISRPIENLINKLSTPNYPNYATATFGVSYESDRSYYLFSVAQTSDTFATQCFRYNTFTNSWTIFDISKRSGVVNFSDDKLYLSPIDVNSTEQERKSFTRIDYADRERVFTLAATNLNGKVLKVSSVVDITVGDVLLQTQYLTITQYNRLLKKLDNDPGVSDSDYYSLLNASSGNNLRNKLTSLATKLDNDPGVNDNNYAASISAFTSSFSDTQLAFNVIIVKLNADLGVSFSNYSQSTGTVDQEVIITSIDKVLSTVTLQYAYPLIQGPYTIFEHIDSDIIWTPQTMNDPSVSKQVSEGTILFEANNFSSAILSFATDLGPGFEPIPFNGDGNGAFGDYAYGLSTYGGAGSAIPFRTLIPLEKQRCRFMKVRFQHGTARELYSIFGVSLTYQVTSQRAYK